MYVFPSKEDETLTIGFDDPIYLIDNYYWNDEPDLEYKHNVYSFGFENLGKTNIDVSFDKKGRAIFLQPNEKVRYQNIELHRKVYFRCKDKEGFIKVLPY